jgi:antitoxin HicB
MWYELRIQPDGDNWLVTAPAFPEVASFGSSMEEALRNGQDAILQAIAGRIADGEDIPLPLSAPGAKGDHVQVPAVVYLKSALYMILREQGKTRADLQRALGWQREAVDRLFRLNHNSRLDSIERAFGALGVPLRFDLPFPAAEAA